MSTKIPILLTSSVISYDKSVRLTDTNERIRLAMESIAQWLNIVPGIQLVLCDGSNFDFSNLVQKNFPNAPIECLFFENNQEYIQRFGRGYGEGEIMRYATNNSHYINKANSFAKCTSKLWVKNFEQCIKNWNNKFLCKGIFLNSFSPFRKTIFSYIDTRFYISSLPFYRMYFEEAHKLIGVRNEIFFSLEDCFHEITIRENLHGILLPIAPVIYGMGGGTGAYYKNTWLRQRKENIRLKLAQKNPTFAKLFYNPLGRRSNEIL